MLWQKFLNQGPFVHTLISFSIHIFLILFCEIQDRYLDVKYTDIDYIVFTDGARFLLNGSTPFDRPTYRYTPILALLMTPNLLWFEQFGKLLFTIFDIIGGILIYNIMDRRYSRHYLLWLYNPFTLIISTRGSAESLICTLVLLVIFCFNKKHHLLAGLCFGFVIHFKIYPIIYTLTFYLALSERNSSLFRSLLPNSSKIMFIISTLIGLIIPTYLSYLSCGTIYLNEAWLYHFYRQDFQHNFSPYFYLFQLFDDISIQKIIGLMAFVPQMLLATIIVPIYYNQRTTKSTTTLKSNICMALFLQTYLFVTLNKVITAQYFEWYLCLLPFIVPFVKITWNKWLAIIIIWSFAILQWLLFAYLYEFRQWNILNWLCVASIIFVLLNLFIIIFLHSNFNALDTKKLKAAGICTIKGINMHMKKKLIQIKGLSEAKVDKIKEAAAKICNEFTFMTASEYREKRKMVFKVSTGCQEF
ncbi:GPI mannosyltransferase 1-like protein, partial [Euroglyphus maynei]